MLSSANHWHPLVNGYSDFLPPDIEAAMPALAQFPSGEALHFLRQRGTRYVLVNWKLYPDSEQELLRLKLAERQDALRPMLNDPDVSMFELITPAVNLEVKSESCAPGSPCLADPLAVPPIAQPKTKPLHTMPSSEGTAPSRPSSSPSGARPSGGNDSLPR
jgi:hypothetical protein